MTTVIDAEDLILGRFSSKIAGRLLDGEQITIVNAEKAIVTGRKEDTLQKYEDRWNKKMLVNPRKGPFYPRGVNKIIRRTIRGMLPWKKDKGKKAFKRLKVYSEVPEKFENHDKEKIDGAHASNLSTLKYMTVGEISRYLGGK